MRTGRLACTSLLLLFLGYPLAAQPLNPISRRIRGFTAPPATCNFNAFVTDFGVDTVAGKLYICTALNTWTALLTSSSGVPSTRTINTTSPLTGGGDLSADRTFACPTCATSSNNLSFFSATSSAQLAALLSDETGFTSGALAVFSKSPTIETPTFSTNFTSPAWKPAADSTSALSVTKADGTTSILTFDTTNKRLGLNLAPSSSGGVHLVAGSAANQQDTIQVNNSDAADTSASAIFEAKADTADLKLQCHGTARVVSRWGGAIGGTCEGITLAGAFSVGTVTTAPLNLGANSTTLVKMDGSTLAVTMPVEALTSGTMTASLEGSPRTVETCRVWTNAMVAALGATTAGDVLFGVLPAKTKLIDATMVITGTAAGVTTLTAAFGRTSATFIDYITASDAKVAANTVYGDASAERGTNLTGWDLPSYTATTNLNVHFISTGANLSAVTGSTGMICVTTRRLP